MSTPSSVSTDCTTESSTAYISCVFAGGSGISVCSRMWSLNGVIWASGTLTRSATHPSDSAS